MKYNQTPKVQILQRNIENLLKDNDKNYIEKITKQINYWYEISGKILDDLRRISNIDNHARKEQLVCNLEKKQKENLLFIEYHITNADDKVIRMATFHQLNYNYLCIKNSLLEIKNDVITKKVSEHSNEFDTTLKKIQKIEKVFEGIGGTIISIVLSVSIVSVAVTAITSIKPIFIPLFIISLVWLGMTFIVFVNGLFDNKDKNTKQSLFLYFCITIIFVIVLFCTLNYINNYGLEM